MGNVISPTTVAPPAGVPPLARGPVFAIAGVVGFVLLVTSGRYGYWGDELYFLAAGRYLDWGYADQPLLVPLLARAMDELFAGSLIGFRLPATLLTAVGVVVAALLARELGGERRAQLLTAGAYATAPFLFGQGHLLSTNTVDVFLWMVGTWLLVRWVRIRDDRLLVWIGVVTAIAVQGKLLLPVLWIAVGVAALLVGPRELIRRPMLWASAAFAALSTVPTLVWQAANGWPQLAVAQATRAEVAEIYGGWLGVVPLTLFAAGLPVGALLLCYGLWRLLRSPQLRAYRFLGIAVLATMAFFVVTGGRFYYAAGLYPLLWAAGAVEVQRREPGWWWGWATTTPAYGVAAVVAMLITLPILPVTQIGRVPAIGSPFAAEEVGWPQLAETVTAAYRNLPPQVRQHTVVITQTYRQAAAIERFAPDELTPAYSGSRGYWYLGQPPADTRTVLFVGADAAYLAQFFAHVRQVATIDNGLGVANVSQGAPVWLCTAPRAPWPELWPHFLAFPVTFNEF